MRLHIANLRQPFRLSGKRPAAMTPRKRVLSAVLLSGLTAGLLGLIGCPAPLPITRTGAAFLYVGNLNNRTLSSYRIGSDGALTPTDTPTTPTKDAPLNIAISPNANFAYVAEGSQIQAFSLHSNGTLTPVASVPITTGVNASQATNNGAFALTVSHSGTYVYALVNVAASSSLNCYNINSDGSLALTSSVPLTGQPNSVAEDQDEVFVTDYTGNAISAFANNNSKLASTPDYTTATHPHPVRIVRDPQQPYLYVSCQDNVQGTGSVMMFQEPDVLAKTFNSGLNLLGSAGTQGLPVALIAVPYNSTSSLLFTPNLQTNTVSNFMADRSAGSVTPLSTPLFTTGSSPQDAASDPSNRFLYVISSNEDLVYSYAIDTKGATGVSVLSTPVPTGHNPFCIATALVGLDASSHPGNSTTGDLRAHVK